MKKLYVGNLSFSTSDEELKSFFESVGSVESAQIIKDKHTNRSKGFGFVEMSSDEDASKAISQLNNSELAGRKLRIDEAKPMKKDFDRSR